MLREEKNFRLLFRLSGRRLRLRFHQKIRNATFIRSNEMLSLARSVVVLLQIIIIILT